MTDLLTHVLLAYAVLRIGGVAVDGVDGPVVVAGMAGAMTPDLTKIGILVNDAVVTDALGLPFSWFALHTVGGVAASAAIGAALVGAEHRRAAAGALLAGGASHLVIDGMLAKPGGVSDPLLWPLTWWRPPTPGLYRSTDVWPLLVAIGLAAAVWLANDGRLHRWFGNATDRLGE